MKFRVIDTKDGGDVFGGLVPEDHAQLMCARPVDEVYPYYKDLKVGETGVYEFCLCNNRTVCNITRVE